MRYCVLALAALLLTASAPEAQTLTAPDGSSVVISRDAYGVPRITASSEVGGFYAQGWAVAQDRLFQMETFWRAATGRLSEIQGSAALSTDQAVRTVFYTPAERAAQFDALPLAIRDGLDAYIAGINAYIDLAESDAATYKPFEYTQFPLNQGPIERWDRDKAVAVLQFFMRRFGEVGGDELARLAELEANGQEWFDANRPINDPEAFTTLDSIVPTVGASAPAPEASGVGSVDPEMVAALRAEREAMEAYLRGLGVPLKLGSFAALVKANVSASGDAMLLGAPQMGNPSQTAKAVTSEVEIAIDGGFHIAGMTVPGIMGVIIGRVGTPEDQRAWTLTTGFTDNTDTFVETLASSTSYVYNGEPRAFEVLTDQIRVLGADDVAYTHFRTVHGPVYAEDFAGGRVFAYQYAFWDRELEMVEAFYSAWQSTSLSDWEQVASEIPMSFNLFYADTEQNVAYWHVGRYPERAVDPRLPASGVGTEEWTGIVPFEDHPQAVNFTQPILVNWNNKPSADWDQGDNVDWTDTKPGGYTRTFDGAAYLQQHLETAQASGDGITFEEVQELTRVVRSNPEYQEYPGTYQQVLSFADGSVTRAENVIPPGQSGFISAAGVPSPHFSDQWPLYISSIGEEPVRMKTFGFSAGTDTALPPEATGAALGAVYPNPTVGALAIDLTLASGAEVRLSLVDVLGREVVSLTEQRATGEQRVTLDATGLAAGTYTLRVQTGEHVQTRRVVIAR
ncbi:penicillin acylase family protein [Rubricoccus marinus]|uniref:Secretion system C-terminal sorting domain-containing protein n=1 Tax=Rubricoccus marinus TaxID=716817 RepID=A0A259TZS9_9BACT|nr:penicillin acylase family protein [Rubricoccus marinus]OZC03200.1 hypothetical protein BSZ36_09570 [Rubricoccus marinus]